MITFNTHTYTKIEVSNDILTDYEEAGYTYLHCTYFTSPRYHGGWWVNITEDCVLTNGDASLKMLNAMNIPLAPKKHYFKKFGDSLQFTLIFPAIPDSWTTFDFKEYTQRQRFVERKFDPEMGIITESVQESGGLFIHNITRNNSGVYRVLIQ